MCVGIEEGCEDIPCRKRYTFRQWIKRRVVNRIFETKFVGHTDLLRLEINDELFGEFAKLIITIYFFHLLLECCHSYKLQWIVYK